jgi:RimJ/RimL family protein N-acetyltransferase
MGEGVDRSPLWLVRGHQVGLAAPEREEFLDRWDLYDDPRIGMLAAFQTAGAAAILKPPLTREHREGIWQAIMDGLLVAFDIRALEDSRFLGEAGLARIQWPHGSADIAVALFDPDDRGHGYGTEAVVLLTAYAFDGLGLNRVAIRYLSVNEAVVRAVERSAEAAGGRLVGVEREADWAYGARRDRVIVECVREDFAPQPATAHLRASGPP